MIQNNLIHQSFLSDVKKLLFLGSSCIYPRLADQPMEEKALLSGYLEPTNEPYAIAKIAGIKMCESYNRQYKTDYRSVMPTNLYGPGDNYHPNNSHVIPGLIRRIHEAKISNNPEVFVWGSGNVLREFMHVTDMATASIFIMNLDEKNYSKVISEHLSHVNIGSGDEISIAELARLIAQVVGFSGVFKQDTSKPDGPPRKFMDSSILRHLGWKPAISIHDGLTDAYQWFLANKR